MTRNLAEVINVFLSFTSQDLQSVSQVCLSESVGVSSTHSRGKKRVRHHLAHLNMQKSMETDGMHRYRKELVSVIARLLSVIAR